MTGTAVQASEGNERSWNVADGIEVENMSGKGPSMGIGGRRASRVEGAVVAAAALAGPPDPRGINHDLP